MIKLATVFSGIGAIEHALSRMELDKEIIFACDNGDIDVLSKEIDLDMDQIYNELSYLKSLIENMEFSDDDIDYENQLIVMLTAAESEYLTIKNKLDESIIDDYEDETINILNRILTNKNLNKTRVIVFNDFLDSLKLDLSKTQKKLYLYRIILKLTNDFKRDNPIEDLGKTDVDFNSSVNINWLEVSEHLKIMYDIYENENGAKFIRLVRNLSKTVGQLYGKINSLHHLDNLKHIGSYSDKKNYIDNLYKGKEKQNKVKMSYMANYKCSEEDFHWDASFLDGNQYKNEVDLFVGGSPCQSFSIVGQEKGLSDTRGTLFYEYARLVNEIQPKIFIYENVRAVLSNDCGKTWEKMKHVFQDLGYNVYFENEGKPSILNSKNYGIPQNRNRLFVVGFRTDLKLKQEFQFPKTIPLEYTMQDFLLENAPYGSFLPKKEVNFVEIENNFDVNQIEKYFLSEKIKKSILKKGTKNFFSKPETDLEIARPLLTTMHKMHRAGVDNYVTTEGRLRRLTPRECLRLMGFSDEWKIVVSDTAMYQQAGNSIVVDVLIHIMEEIIKCYPAIIE